MKISYKKCFNLGNYENEVIMIESDDYNEEITNAFEVFESLKNDVEKMHVHSMEMDRIRQEEARQKRLQEHPCCECYAFGHCDKECYDKTICDEFSEYPF